MKRHSKEKMTKLKAMLFEGMMIVLSLIVLVPILMVVLGSFKTTTEAVNFNLKLPEVWQFSNYTKVFIEGKLSRAFFNSTFITFAATTVCIMVASMASFILARRVGRLVTTFSSIFMIGMIAPMSMIPTIRVLKMLRLTGSYTGVIFLYIAINIPYSILIFTQFIRGLPRELDESAIIDGCGPYRTYFSVILPLLKPVTVTALVIVVMNVWNGFMIPLYFFGNSKKWTMPLTVYNFFGRYAREWNLVFADLILTALPVVLIYLICQKYIVSGLTAGSVKG